MLKRFSSIFTILLIFCVAPLLADDCTDGLTEAKALYNSGNYQKAKELFEYVQSECPYNYTESSNWIAKCNDALKPKTSNTKQSTSKKSSTTTSYLKVNSSSSNSTIYLMNTSSSKTITISCSTSYSIYNIPSWCSITNRTSTSFTLNYQANPNTYKRYGSIDISGGGTSIRLSLEQTAKNTSSQTNTSTSSYLTVNGYSSNSTVYLTCANSSKTITVSCSGSYSISNVPSWCSITNRTNTSFTLNFTANPNTYKRYGSIDISGGGKNIRLSLEQVAKTTSSNYNSNNHYHTSSYSFSKYDQYCINNGDYEITWFGIRAGICTGISYGYRLFSFRLGPVQINPAEITIDYNFVNEEIAGIYTPSVDFLIPFQEDAALYFGGGPSVHLGISDETYVWADVSAGVHWHWGVSASSDFFLRYNGSFMFGISIQWSTDY